MNFKAIHTAIKKSIVGSGFKYMQPKERSKLDFEPDNFDRSSKNYGFTIRINAQSFAANESLKHVKLNFIIEFILDGAHDGYLDKIDDAMTAIWNLVGVVNSTAQTAAEDRRSWAAFNMEWRDDFVILVFPNITFTMKSS